MLDCPGLRTVFQINVHIFMEGKGEDGKKKNLAIQHSVYFLMAGTPTHLHL